MIWEVISGILGSAMVVNGFAAFMVYHRYLQLAAASMEYAAMVIESIEEGEDGSITIDPVALVGTSMDHISYLSGLLKWVRF